MNFILISILTVLIYFINLFFIKKNYLQSLLSGENHQKITVVKSIPLSGGIFLSISFLIFFYSNFNFVFIFFILSVFTIGFLSDIRVLVSAKIRLLIQSLLIFLLVTIYDLKISSIRIDIFDYLLDIQLLNYFFVSFCILIIINGTNFLDGLNTLVIGYYLIITFIILQLNFFNFIEIDLLTINSWIFILSIIYLFNFFDKLYLGDGGAYFLGIVYSLFLIIIYQNSQISPYFIVLLLWYPGLENLFSIIRKLNFRKNSPLLPDGRHLHQLIFLNINRRLIKNKLIANIFSANIINLYNLSLFLIASQFIYETKIQLFLILINIILYILLYNFLLKKSFLKFKKV